MWIDWPHQHLFNHCLLNPLRTTQQVGEDIIYNPQNHKNNESNTTTNNNGYNDNNDTTTAVFNNGDKYAGDEPGREFLDSRSDDAVDTMNCKSDSAECSVKDFVVDSSDVSSTHAQQLFSNLLNFHTSATSEVQEIDEMFHLLNDKCLTKIDDLFDELIL